MLRHNRISINQFLLDILARLDRRFNLRLAVPIVFFIFMVLLVTRWVWKVPKPLLLVVGVTFLIWFVIFWGIRRGVTRDSHSPVMARTQMTQLLLGWGLITGLLLGSIYYIDRAGWLWFQVTGYEVTLAEDFSDLVDLSIVDFVRQYPFFSINPHNPSELILAKGEYEIKETIVIPKGTSLLIEPGTILRFGVGRSLISYSPLIARGTQDEPILFTSQNKWLKWGVVGIVEADRSVFEYVKFEHGRQAWVNGIDFFGALSLIGTDAEIRYSRFVNLFGKDGIYVRDGDVIIQENIFHNIYRDGLDLDDGSGKISDNQLINCGDEGIDLGSSREVQVFDNRILDLKGGRISADYNLDEIISLNTLGYSNSY